MWRVGIADSSDGALGRLARKKLMGLPLIFESYEPSVYWDAAVVAEDAANVPELLRCGAAIIPGSSEIKTEARCVIGYGMAGTDTLTLASGRNGCTASLRRDIIGFGGETVCRQDAVFDFELSAGRALPLAALAFLCMG